MSITSSKTRFILKWGTIAVLLVVGYLLAFTYLIDKRPFVEWTIINVNSGELQADAHLLKMPDGQIFMIDVGDNENVLLPFLKKQKITDIDKLLISHMHKDHYGALVKMLESGIRIKELRLNLPSQEQCQLEVPWGCDYAHIQNTLSAVKKKGLNILAETAGDIYFNDGFTKLEVLYAYDGLKTPIGKTDVNDMSVLLRLSQGTTRILFTGDLNNRMGEYLAKNFGSELKADILKVPHHGTESVVPNIFFDQVGAKLVIIPSPKTLWLSDRSKRIREYFEKAKIPFYVSGIHGHLKILLQGKNYKVKPVRPSTMSYR